MLHLTPNTKTPFPAQRVGELNLSMLLPVPQYNHSDQLKPIFDFLGGQSDGKSKSLLGENLPVPKDSRPLLSNKKDTSTSAAQGGIGASSLAKHKGITLSRKLPVANLALNSEPGVGNSQESPTKKPEVISRVNPTSSMKSVSSNEANVHDVLNAISPLSKNSPPQTSLESSMNQSPNPQVSTTIEPFESLIKTFLTSKFGQTLSKSLLDSGRTEDSSYKNIMAQHFGSAVQASPPSVSKTSTNEHTIANLLSGLIHQPSGHGPARISAANKDNEQIATKGNNKMSSATISIGNKEFSLADLSKALNNDQEAPNELQGTKTEVQSSKESHKQRTKEKIRKLNEKIATLETLSDALDALTTRLSPEESQGENKQEEISPSSEEPVSSGRDRRRKHHTHHRRHHQSYEFTQDMNMIGSLLGWDTPDTEVEKETPLVRKKDEDSNSIEGIKGNKGLSSKDLQTLQSKINQAIELAETAGRKNDSKRPTPSALLPLLLSGKLGEDVGAQTREEVATIHSSQGSSKGFLPATDKELQALQDILTRLIDNAMRKGTLKQLVKRWDKSGGPFADIARNISEYLKGNSKMKRPVTLLGVAKNFAGKGATVPGNLTSQLSKGVAGQNSRFNDIKTSALFTEAVNELLGALSKRHGLHRRNSTNRSSFVSTNTLVNFKGVLLGGRINKLPPPEDPLAVMESKVLAEILSGKQNKTLVKNSSGANKALNKDSSRIDLTHNNHTQLVQHPLGEQSKQKLSFSSYEKKNVSKSIRNNTLMDFMNSMEISERAKSLPKNAKPGNKHSKVSPHIDDLMTVIAASLLDLNEVKEGNSSKHKPLIKYDESGIDKFPNDHKISDFSSGDAILQAPTDHSANVTSNTSSSNRSSELNKSTKLPIKVTLQQNNTKDVLPNEKAKVTAGGTQKIDSGDQTVTLTLETLDDVPTPSQPPDETSTIQTGLRNNKVPHYLNVQSVVTLGKINATHAKDKEHSFTQRIIKEEPKVESDFTADTRKPEVALPSDDDGKLTTISASPELNPETEENTQKPSNPDLPLNLQMNAIGRIAGNTDQSSFTPADLSAALTSIPELSPGSLASNNGETKSFEDKVLPIASDLTLSTDSKSRETESIVSKVSPSNDDNSSLNKPSSTTITQGGDTTPTAAEIREISTSIKALLKVLNTYSKKLRLEDDQGEEASPKGTLPTSSSTVSKMNTSGTKVKEEELKKPWKTELPATKYTSNVYASFPVSSPTLPKYADSGVFENIQEQPRTEASNFNWNPAQERMRAQLPFDVSPTKTSLEPQMGAEQWRPGNEMNTIGEELKELNLPSIEDDPTVRAVQKMVADENALISQKRKAIQRVKPQVSSTAKSQPPGRLGVFSRNKIPKHRGHPRNSSLVEGKKNHKKFPSLDQSNKKMKKDARGRNIIAKLSNDTSSHHNTSIVGNITTPLPTPQRNVTHQNDNKFYVKKVIRKNTHYTKTMRNRDEIPGEPVNTHRLNDSAYELQDKWNIQKGPVHTNITSAGVSAALKSTKHGKRKGKTSAEEKSYDGSHRTNVVSNVKSVKKITKGKLNVAVIKGIAPNINGTVLKQNHDKQSNVTSKIN